MKRLAWIGAMLLFVGVMSIPSQPQLHALSECEPDDCRSIVDCELPCTICEREPDGGVCRFI